MSINRHADDILNINVGGKKYTVRRTDLLADPRSKLAEWFKTGTTRTISSDKGGNFYLDRDSKTFRHIINYLRLKKEGIAVTLALPAKPDDLARLIAECHALNLLELKGMAYSMLRNYLRIEEQSYTISYAQETIQDFDAWQFEQDEKELKKSSDGKKFPKRYSIGSRTNSGDENYLYDEW